MIRRVTEELDENGWLTVYNPTKRKNKFKYIRLHEDHIVMWEELQRQFPALPETPFFRHHGRVRGTTQTGIIFGEHYLRRWWLRACDEIGLKGVPLYPGTKHTTATETAKLMGRTGIEDRADEQGIRAYNEQRAFEVVQNS